MKIFRSQLGLVVFVAVFSLLGLLAVFILEKYSQEGFEGSQAISCGKDFSFFQEQELYNFEKGDFSSFAKAFKIRTVDGDFARVIFDVLNDQEKSRILISITNLSDRSLAFKGGDLSFLTQISDSQFNFEDQQWLAERGQSAVFVSDRADDYWGEIVFDFSLSSGRACKARVSGEMIADKSLAKAFKSRISGSTNFTLEVPPGTIAVGFRDWIKADSFFKSQVKVLSFNREKAGLWADVSTDPLALLEPGVGYYLQNDLDKTVFVDIEEPYKVPDNIKKRTIRKGWNLVYNDLGRDITSKEIVLKISSGEFKDRNIYLEGKTIGELISNNLVSAEGFEVAKFQDRGVLDIAPIPLDSSIIADEAVFWLYLFDEEPIQKFKIQDFNFSLKTDKDDYTTGEEVRMSFKIENTFQESMQINMENQDDDCQNGFVVAKGNRLIYSTFPYSFSACPNWPRQANLHSGGQIEYNRLWRIPENVSGQLRIIGYFDQSRTFSKDKKIKQVFINVKNE